MVSHQVEAALASIDEQLAVLWGTAIRVQERLWVDLATRTATAATAAAAAAAPLHSSLDPDRGRLLANSALGRLARVYRQAARDGALRRDLFPDVDDFDAGGNGGGGGGGGGGAGAGRDRRPSSGHAFDYPAPAVHATFGLAPTTASAAPSASAASAAGAAGAGAPVGGVDLGTTVERSGRAAARATAAWAAPAGAPGGPGAYLAALKDAAEHTVKVSLTAPVQSE